MIIYDCNANVGVREQEGFKSKDYLFHSLKGNLAEITISKRYPETGWVRNTASDMFVRVLEGYVSIFGDRARVGTFHGPGGTLLVQAGTLYYWEPSRSKTPTLLVFSSPPWTPELHVHVPE